MSSSTSLVVRHVFPSLHEFYMYKDRGQR